MFKLFPMMRNLLFVTILLLFFSNVHAQRRLNYKDVYELVLNAEKEEVYAILLTYQRQDPEFANTYFQLGLIADEWAREYDPLTEYDYVKQFIYDTKLYYGLALLKLKDEKNRNRNFYINGANQFQEEKFSVSDIEQFVQMKLDEIEQYEAKITEIVGYFNKSSDCYNECLFIFKDINEDYSKIKNIWVSNDPDLTERLDLLQKKFDTTLTALDKYRKSIRDFPVKDYNQRYSLADIYTYRLHGLTPANFLNDDIVLWDYNSWVEQIKTIHQSTIGTLRQDIESEQHRVDSLISLLENKKLPENYQNYSVPKTLLFRVEQIDYQSLVTSLFKAQDAYIRFLQFYVAGLEKNELQNESSLKTAALHYRMLTKKLNETRSACADFDSDIRADKIKKHKDFFMAHFGGLSGLKEYRALIEVKTGDVMQGALIDYRESIDKYLQKKFPEGLAYRSKSIFYPGLNYKISELKTNSFFVSQFEYGKQDQCRFAGFFLDEQRIITPFYGQADSTGSMQYFKHYTDADYQGLSADLIQHFENGSVILLAPSKDSPNKTRIIKLEENGRELYNETIDISLKPSFLAYDDINNIADIIFQDYDSRLEYAKYDLKSKNIVFKTDLKAWGEVFGFLRSEKNNLIFINFRTLIDQDGQSLKAQPENNREARDPALIIVNDEGTAETVQSYIYENSVKGRLAIKIDSKTINITGVEYDRYGKVAAGPGLYVILDQNGKVIWKNRHN